MTQADFREFRQIQDDIFNSFSFNQNYSYGFKKYLSKRVSQLFKTPLGFVGKFETKTNVFSIQTGLSGVTFSPNKFQFSITPRVRIRLWSKLLLQIVVVQLVILLPIRKKFPKATKFNLIFSLSLSQISHNGSTRELLEFLQDPRFEMNSEFDFYLVEGKCSRSKRNLKNKMIITRNIPIYIARNFFSYRSRFKLFLLTFPRLLSIYRSVKCCPIILLGANALTDESIYEFFFRDFQNITLITTPSQLTLQSIAFEMRPVSKHSRRIMMWYSSNAMPFKYSNPSLGKTDESIFTCASIDEQWVWTEEHGSYLSRLNQKPAIVKGSMTFYLPNFERTNFHNSVKKILLFDVTPQNVEGTDGTMYSLENTESFISEVVEVVQELESKLDTKFEILLKPKRDYYKTHSSQYASFLQKYQSVNRIQLLKAEANLYSIIQDSDVVICIPFTSPAIIANEIGVPSCYFTSMEKVTLPEISNGSQVIRSTSVLSQFLVNSLGLTQNLASDEY